MENRIFDSELEKLTHKVKQMCSQVNQQVNDALTALKEYDMNLARKVISNDNAIDTLDVKIDKLCQKIFALQQPVASDLRYILSALKINNDLERVGDHAVNIAKRIAPLEDYRPLVNELGVDQIGHETSLLFADVLSLVESHDLKYCKKIYTRSSALKEACEAIAKNILDEMMHKSEVVVVASNILIIVNLIERIASYSNNIAESITFVEEGEIVKHKKRSK
ncbi:MAG TPA: phosphate signaling complex protein PhoU [Prolixibacteraceae bacterium]|nr:phosphate signaling complex protein PhoU [Prolixibacteraceae bacterium]